MEEVDKENKTYNHSKVESFRNWIN